MKTKYARVDAANPDEAVIQRAAALVKKGEVIVCPTDTGYAFAANALNVKAIARVFQLKGRAFSNPIHIGVMSMAEVDRYARVTNAARRLAQIYLPGALTLVLKKRETVPSLLVAGMDTVGIRIPDDKVMLMLAQWSGLPLTTTSANISGKPGTYAVEEITAQLGEAMGGIAMVLDEGPIKRREVSTIVDLTVSPPELIRQGKISWLDIRDAVKGITD